MFKQALGRLNTLSDLNFLAESMPSLMSQMAEIAICTCVAVALHEQDASPLTYRRMTIAASWEINLVDQEEIRAIRASAENI